MKFFTALLLLSTLALPLGAAEAPVPPPDLKAIPADAEHEETGLASKVLVAGTGKTHPGETDTVRVHYTVWTSEGKLIDHKAAPTEVMIAMFKMIPGWRAGVLKMVEGEQRRTWVPESLGAKGKVPAGGMLVIDTELLEIIPPPATPPDVAAPPATAVKKGGISYVVLREGTGTKRPSTRNTVRVHYSGWTTDGKLFDSSLQRGDAAEFPLTGVIPGWQTMLQQMVEGERVRVWIPQRQAYDGASGKPRGMLVFELELLAIE